MFKHSPSLKQLLSYFFGDHITLLLYLSVVTLWKLIFRVHLVHFWWDFRFLENLFFWNYLIKIIFFTLVGCLELSHATLSLIHFDFTLVYFDYLYLVKSELEHFVTFGTVIFCNIVRIGHWNSVAFLTAWIGHLPTNVKFLIHSRHKLHFCLICFKLF